MARDDPDMEEDGIGTAGVARLPPRNVLRRVPAEADAETDAAAQPVGAADPEAAAREALAALRQRHRDLDAAIEALQLQGSDPFTVRRLKKRKLALRDRIAAIEDELTPDIIA